MRLSRRVLVDSSAWISYFSDTRETVLSTLIEKDLVCTNELILTELIPFLLKAKQRIAAIDQKLVLFTYDKHFYLMQKNLNFELLETEQ